MTKTPRIYTRVGDGGRTKLLGGSDVSKTDQRIEAYGTVDELNASVGVALVELRGLEGDDLAARIERFLTRTQVWLFELGAELSCPPEARAASTMKLEAGAAGAVEQEIDGLTELLPPLTAFVLPGGGRAGATLQLCRTVCRRAEREVVRLHEQSPVRAEALVFLNRLSDYLFVAGRAAAAAAGVGETLWAPRE